MSSAGDSGDATPVSPCHALQALTNEVGTLRDFGHVRGRVKGVIRSGGSKNERERYPPPRVCID